MFLQEKKSNFPKEKIPIILTHRMATLKHSYSSAFPINSLQKFSFLPFFVHPYTPCTWMYCLGCLKLFRTRHGTFFSSSLSGVGITSCWVSPYTCCADMALCRWCSCSKNSITNLTDLSYFKICNKEWFTVQRH